MDEYVYWPELDDGSDKLFHYGTPRHSGRYPWGSGDSPYQHEAYFLGFVSDLKKQGYSEKQIAEYYGVSIAKLRAYKKIAKEQQWAADRAEAIRLKDSGMSTSAVARQMGKPESTVRTLLDPVRAERNDVTMTIANLLKDQIEGGKLYLDVGKGVDKQLGISKEQLKTAIAVLEEQGYKLNYIKVEQATNPGKYTSVQVLSKNDVPWTEINENRDQIRSPQGVWLEDSGRSLRGIETPTSVDSDRIAIRYADDGGSAKDGVIELRPGVADISLGDSRYAQVRIAVDGTHYLKGMAMYSTDLPDGVDIMFNTNKHSDKSKMEVLKKMDDDPDNPFGSTVRQRRYIGEDGQEHLSAINIVNEDTDWEKWSKTLSSQVLSKQSPVLAQRQLDLKYQEMLDSYEEIRALTNPAVKKRLLESFADDCDSAAVHLKAAALPRQATKVILPLNSIKDTEVYAPTYQDGEEVVLIRYPHGGTFEIPRLRVNNKNAEGREILGNAANAIGINAKVAEQLSGADFDGDTVTVIPTRGQNIKTSSPLKGLEGFDPKERYPAYEGMPEVGPANKFHKQAEMGKVSNLITDMTIKGATEDEIARAVRHSMVVIDAEKHNLNWEQSYVDNGIAQLKEKYQGGKNAGASTIISRAKGQESVVARSDSYDIDPETGAKIYKTPKSATWVDKETGETHVRTERSTKMAEASDAFDLVSRDENGTTTRIETVYATHANKLKALANEARKEILATPNQQQSATAKKVYADEVASLDAKLNTALRNAPNERLAQLTASKIFEAKCNDNPRLKEDKAEAKKVRAQIIEETRARAGSSKRSKRQIQITDREWEAIQAGAISHNKLTQILANTDLEEIQRRATPRNTSAISPAKLSRAKALIDAGHTWAEVADLLGVSASTLRRNING